MKKILICTIFIGMMNTLKAQDTLNLKTNPIFLDKSPMDFKHPRSAGDEMQISSKHFYEGVGLTVLGGGILFAVSYSDLNPDYRFDKDSKKIMNIFGSIISVGGLVLICESKIHIKRAGIILNKNGIGLKINL